MKFAEIYLRHLAKDEQTQSAETCLLQTIKVTTLMLVAQAAGCRNANDAATLLLVAHDIRTHEPPAASMRGPKARLDDPLRLIIPISTAIIRLRLAVDMCPR